MNTNDLSLTSRRQFIKTSTRAAIAGVVATPALLGTKSSAASPGETIRIGLIGCGGRGSGAAQQALKADKNAVLTALGDAFQDRLDSSLDSLKQTREIRERVLAKPENCFVGLDAYRQVLESGVDLVILATPPGFRPMHLKAAVEAGKHIFTEKPMATDAPGLRTVLASVEEAKKRHLAVVAGFCWRYNLAERAAFEKILAGEIGDVRACYGTYLTGFLWSKARQPNMTDLEWQLRNWLYFTWLSGDHYVEQAVHTVDKMCWAMKDQPPVKCVALGGRQVRTAPEFGHIYDHFAVSYEYASGARGFIFARQQAGCANDNSDTIYGTKGTARIPGFGGAPFIKDLQGEIAWRYRGPRPDMYQVEHNELFASIRAGQPINDGVWMAHSTMAGIMGRMAAYTGKEITWEEALNSQEDLFPKSLSLDQSLPTPPVAMPGVMKFI